MNDQLNRITLQIIFLIGIIFAFVAFYLFLGRVDRFLKYQAIDNCAKISQYERTDQEHGTRSLIPDKTVFDSCLKQKGI